MRNRILFVGLQLVLLNVVRLGFAADSGAKTYADAYKTTQDTGKPLVVLIGADWCPYCQVMKTSVMPQVAAHGDLASVSFAYMNSDQQRSGRQNLKRTVDSAIGDVRENRRGLEANSPGRGTKHFVRRAVLGAAKASVAAQKPAGDSQPAVTATTAATTTAAVASGKTTGS